MKNTEFYTWLNEYINIRQKIIDIILEKEDKQGICNITLDEVANKLKTSKRWLKHLIETINRDELIINSISENEFIINQKNFSKSKTILEYNKLIIYFKNPNNYVKSYKQIIEETGIEKRKIEHVKSALGRYTGKEVKKELKVNNKIPLSMLLKQEINKKDKS